MVTVVWWLFSLGFNQTHNLPFQEQNSTKQSDGEVVEFLLFYLFFIPLSLIQHPHEFQPLSSEKSHCFTCTVSTERFHTVHPLTVNLHRVTAQIHHHSSYVGAEDAVDWLS